MCGKLLVGRNYRERLSEERRQFRFTWEWVGLLNSEIEGHSRVLEGSSEMVPKGKMLNIKRKDTSSGPETQDGWRKATPLSCALTSIVYCGITQNAIKCFKV